MTAPTELMKGNASLLILSVLANEPMHGYRIAKRINEISKGYFELGEGALYPHLHHLEQRGFVEGYWENSPVGRKRKCYQVTDEGLSELGYRKREWKEFQSEVNRILGLSPSY